MGLVNLDQDINFHESELQPTVAIVCISIVIVSYTLVLIAGYTIFVKILCNRAF